MKRFISLVSILLCLALCLSVVGCTGSSYTDDLNANRSTVGLDELYSVINGDKVVGDISSNDASNTSTVTVTVQSDDGTFPCYVLGKVVGGKSADGNNAGGNNAGGDNGSGGNGNNSGGTNTDSSKRGIDYLLERSVSCAEPNPKVGKSYNLYYEEDDGSKLLANIKNLPDLYDGDEISIDDEYSFTYIASEDKWLCTKVPDVKVKGYYSTDNFTPVHIVSKELQGKASEGCQWLSNMCMDTGSTNGLVGYACVDVAAPYKTEDGGKTWKPVSVGWAAEGSQSVAIDPKNPDHVVGAGMVGIVDKTGCVDNGVYLSTNGAETWTHVYYWPIQRSRYINQFVFDESSYDASENMCMTIYWSSEDYPSLTGNSPSLHKSTDGGKTWEVVNENFGGCILKISPDGTLYAGKYTLFPSVVEPGTSTLYKSTDGGKTFKELPITDVYSFDTIAAKPNNVYAAKADGFYVSTDKGESFTKISEGMFYEHVYFMSVNCDGTKISAQIGYPNNNAYKRIYSHDGGKTWTEINIKDSVQAGAFMPLNSRAQPGNFSGTDPNLMLIICGDTIARTDDAGKTFTHSNYGYNGVCTDLFSFNVQDANLMMVPIQDYSGAFSTDGGKSFTFLAWGQNVNSGNTYGGYVIDEKTMFTAGVLSWWNRDSNHYIYTTFDGGVTLNKTKKYKLADDALANSLGSLHDKKIAFIGDMRTTDAARTWTQMTNILDKSGAKTEKNYIIGVWCIDRNTGRLYAQDKLGYLVYSDDDGATWKQFVQIPMPKLVKGVSCDKDGGVYVVAVEGGGGGGVLIKTTVETGKWESLVNPAIAIRSYSAALEVDFENGTIYLSSSKGSWPKQGNLHRLWRSEDGGKTWVPLSVISDSDGNKSGNLVTEVYPENTVTHIAINYETDEVYFNFSCRGIWKIGRV
ncbi:MAG: hypothetical protein UHN02_03460 [Acutalibacteraceae bacterium]|nr:hypothetical protein [Acutalibacteraceae bacterium]